ncbi:hypothetical protein [Hymenobacter sp.]|uniref:hypothetical protein n=1 Tax=Hymenobacter sp. TaxID=1898978 RepID=UPI00286C8CFE|nr:hypothetical protein [Hymenobacter sp.]
MNPTSTVSARRSRPSLAARAAVAIIYLKVGNVLRVPLRRTRTGGAHGCQQHPERQFITWFNRMMAARPGFPAQVKSILLITGEPLCASCYRALARYLGRFHLAGKLRLRPAGPAPGGCGCWGRCGCGGAVPRRFGKLLLDEVLFESELEAEGWWERAKDLGRAAVLTGALALGPRVLPQPVYNMAKAAATAQAERRKRQQAVDDNTPQRPDPGREELNERAGSSELGRALAEEFEFGYELEAPPVIDARIDVFAQYALQRMLRSDSLGERGDALAMLAAVKRQGPLGLNGIYKEDERAPALWARRRGKGWWQVLGSDKEIRTALLVWADPALPSGPFRYLLVFRDSIRSNAAVLDPALRQAWQMLVRVRDAKLANPALTPRQAWMAQTGTTIPATEPGNSSAIFRLRLVI